MAERRCHFVNALTALVDSQQADQEPLWCQSDAASSEGDSKKGAKQEPGDAGWVWDRCGKTWKNARLDRELSEQQRRSEAPQWNERVVRATAEAEAEQQADEKAQGASTELDRLGIDIEAETTLSLDTVAALALGNERIKHFRAAQRNHESEMSLWFARPDSTALLGDTEHEDDALGQLVQLAEEVIVRRLKDAETRQPGH